MDRSTRNLLAIANIAALADARYSLERLAKIPKRPEKPCLYCRKPHNHNNSFCSAECCRNYRFEKASTPPHSRLGDIDTLESPEVVEGPKINMEDG